MKTFKLFNFNLRSSAKVQADGCTAARQKIGVNPTGTPTFARFASSLCLILTMLFTLGVGQMWGADASSANFYYDNSSSSWSDVQILLGHSTYSEVYAMTKLTNSNQLYYKRSFSWGGYSEFYFVTGCSGWGSEGNSPTSRSAYCTNSAKLTTNVGSKTWLFISSGGSDGSSVSVTDCGTSYDNLNYTYTVNQELTTNGGSSYSASTASLATVKVASYKLNSATATSATAVSGTISAGNSSANCKAVRTATVTYSVDKVATGYSFVGWYDGNTQKSTSATYSDIWAISNTTITARFTQNFTAGDVIYLLPNSTWKNASGLNHYAAYFYGSGGNTWVNCSQVGSSDYYSVTVPSGNWGYVIFVALNNATNNWSYKIYQTDDLMYDASHNGVEITGSNNSQSRITVYDGLSVSRTPTAAANAPTIGQTLIKSGSSVSIVAQTEKTGYHWVNWTTSNGSFGSSTTKSTTFTPTASNASAVANYALNTYTVAYNANDDQYLGTATGSTSSSSHTYGTAKSLTSNGFSRTGYTFAGWATSPTGDVTYSDGQSVTNLTSTNGATVTLYAKWNLQTYNITYKDQGNVAFSGTHGDGYPTTHTYGSATALVSPTKDGFTFGGWYGNSSCTGVVLTSIGATARTADFTLYAKWTENTYDVAVTKTSGGSVTPTASWTAMGVVNGGSITATPNTGYDFDHWSVVTSSGGYFGATGTATTTTTANTVFRPLKNNVTIKAWFTAKTINLTLDKNGGDSDGSATVLYNATSLATKSDASRAGYSLTGYWTAESGGSKVINTDGSLNNVEGWVSGGYWAKATDGTLYAQWEVSVVNYTLNFTAGTSSTGYVTVAAKNSSTEAAISYGASVASGTGVTVTATPETHYKFVGWYSNAACTSSVSTDNPYSFTMSANTSLYAKVELMTTTVTFNKNGGSGSTPATLTATHGSSSLSSGYVAPTRTGYTFNGWYDAESGGNKVFGTNGVITASSGYADGSSKWTYTGSTLTVYAHWTAKNYTVTLEKQSGSGGPASVSATYDAAMPSATMPTRTGYDFLGYFGSTGGSGTKYYNADGSSAHAWDVASTTTIYANWSIKNYSITYSPVSAPTGCTYTTKPTSADYNSTVTMVITPSTGYTVSVSAVDASSNVVTISNPSANTYTFTQPASAVTVTVTATETKSTVTVTTATTTYGSLKFGETSKSWGATASVGVATTQSITATAAEGFKFARWDLSGSAATSSDLTSATITLKADGSGATGTATAVFEEDLSSPYVLKGGTVFGGTAWETEHALIKKSGSSTIDRAYFSVAIDKTNTGASDGKYQFKIYKPSTKTYYGLTGDGQFYYERSHSANAIEMSSPGINIELRADKTGTYEIEVDYRTGTPKITVLFPGQNLHGNFTGEWESHEFTDGKVSVNITSTGTYEFKVSDGAWYGNNATISATETDWVFYSDNNNCHLEVSTTGTYIFGWNRDDKILSVFYPADQENLTLTKNTYIYFDARDMTGTNEDYWQRGDFTAKFWFKDFASGVDVGNNECAKSSALDGWVYYAEVPNNDYVGRIQLNRLPVGVEGLCSSNVAHAYLRTDASQNCLTSESGKEDYCNAWTPQWTTYCPPMSSATLAHDGTTVTYGGNGESSTPYLVAASSDIKVSATSVSALDDANMTAYYQFKKAGSNDGDESATATHTYTASSTNQQKQAMTVVASNYYNSTYGTASSASNAIYYESRTPYNIAYNKGSYGTGDNVTDIKVYDVNITIRSYLFTRTGYNQTAWDTNSAGTGGTSYASGATYTGNAALTLYPTWTAKQCTVTFDKEGGEGGDNGTTATYDAAMTTVEIPHRIGYAFGGYFDGDNGTGNQYYKADGTSYTNWNKDTESATTLYAKWTSDTNTFTGATNTNWATGTNWSKGSAPTDDYSTVTISSNVTIADGTTAHVGEILISAGSLTIQPGGALEVAGTIKKSNGDPTETTDIIINTSYTKQASLILDNSAADTKATVLVTSTAAKVEDTYSFQYIAVPMTSVSVQHSFSGQGIYTYVWNEGTGWERRNYYYDLYAFEGVGLTQASASGYGLTGTLATTNNQTFALTYTSETAGAGMNMIGNSWTSPISIAALHGKITGNATSTVYVYDSKAGTWPAYPTGSAGTDVVPAMQAYLILATSGGGSLQLNYDEAVRGVASANRTPALRAPKREIMEMSDIYLHVSDNNVSTDLRLCEAEQFTNAFDNGWEAIYIEGEGRSGQLYAQTDEKMAVLATPSLEGTVVGFIPGNAANYTISFSGTETGYYLNDMLMEQSTLITEDNTYEFVPDENTNATRFVISKTPIMKTPTGVEDNEQTEINNVRKLIINDKLYIIRAGRIYNATGALVK